MYSSLCINNADHFKLEINICFLGWIFRPHCTVFTQTFIIWGKWNVRWGQTCLTESENSSVVCIFKSRNKSGSVIAFPCTVNLDFVTFEYVLLIQYVPQASESRRPKCDRITPPHLLSWPCCLRFASMYKADSCNALQPSITRPHNAGYVTNTSVPVCNPFIVFTSSSSG